MRYGIKVLIPYKRMQGARYGTIIKTHMRLFDTGYREVAVVKLDRSGKNVRVLFDDCTVVPS